MYRKAKVVMLSTKKAVWPNCIWLGRITNQLRLDQSYNETTIKDPTDDSMLPQHLYIISNDEIKEDDWFITKLFKIDGTFDGLHLEQANYIEDVWINKGVTIKRHSNNCKKIIATTDTSLTKPKFFKYGNMIMEDINEDGSYYNAKDTEVEFSKSRSYFINLGLLLSQLSQAFIERYVDEYNKGNTITDITVDYEEYYVNNFPTTGVNDNTLIYIPKVYNDNTIGINLIEKKDSFSREEVIEILRSVMIDCDKYQLNYHYDGEYIDLNKWIEQNL